jgi:hypothetical protein
MSDEVSDGKPVLRLHSGGGSMSQDPEKRLLLQRLRRCERELLVARRAQARCKGVPSLPFSPVWTPVLGALAIGLTFALAMHDIVFVGLIPDRVQCMVFSLFAGAIVGGLGVSASYASARMSRGFGFKLVWFVAAFVLALAVFLLRLSILPEGEPLWGPLGWSLAELAGVVFVELNAGDLRRSLWAVEKGSNRVEAAERRVVAAKEAVEAAVAALGEKEKGWGRG